MNNKNVNKWFFYFSLGTFLIIIFKTIDSVYQIAVAFGNFLKVMMPFVIAIIFAYVLYLPAKSIEKLISSTKVDFLVKNKRRLSTFLIYFIVFFIIAIIFTFVIPSISTSAKELVNQAPKYIDMLNKYINEASEDSWIVRLGIREYISNLGDFDISSKVMEYISVKNLWSYLQSILGGASIIFDIFVTIVVSVYILAGRDSIKKFLSDFSYAMLDDKAYELCASYARKMNTIFSGFVTGQLIDALVVGFITSIAMLILKVRYAVLLGFVIGLLNIIPYFGAIIGVVFAIIITLFTGGVKQTIIMGIVVIALQQIDANIINPRIIKGSLHISPILVILAVTIGGTYFGALGMFLGVPVLALLKEMLLDFLNFRNRVKIAKFEEQIISEFDEEEISKLADK